MKKLISLILGIFALLLWPTQETEARSLSMPSYTIDAYIQTNGDVRFVEEWELEAKGSYNGIYYDLDVAETSTLVDVETVRIKNARGTFLAEPYQDTNRDGYYYTTQYQKQFFSFRIYAPFSDERQSIQVTYTIRQLIDNHTDAAEFNRKVVGTKWDMNQSNITVNIHLPKSLSKETLLAWGHGSADDGTITYNADYSMVTYKVPVNRKGQFVEAHLIFPPSVTHSNRNKTNQPGWDAIVQQEAELARRKAAHRAFTEKAPLYFGLSLIPLVLLFVAAIIQNRRYKAWLTSIPRVPHHLFDIPADITPAIMSTRIYLRNTSEEDISATLLDLVRKRHIQFTANHEGLVYLDKDTSQLRDHELNLLKFFFNTVAKGSTLLFSQLEAYAKKSPDDYSRFIKNWNAKVKKAANALKPTDTQTAFKHRRAIFTVLSLIFSTLPIIVSIIGFGIKEVIALVVSITGVVALGITVLVVAKVFESKRTKQEMFAFMEWQAFAQMLKDISHMEREQVASIVIWDHILVYATSLGLASQVIRDLGKKIPDFLENSELGMTFFHAQAINNAVYLSHQIMTSNTSSGFGGGGGFSSGGSGGASGGGGF